MLNKGATSSKTRKNAENLRTILLDCPLEYRKGGSQTNIEIAGESDWKRLPQIETKYMKKFCRELLAFKPNLFIAEKRVLDLSLHMTAKNKVGSVERI